MTIDARKKTRKVLNRLRFYVASGTIAERQVLIAAADELERLQKELDLWQRIAMSGINAEMVAAMMAKLEYENDLG
jgi:hypothetical protein